MTRFTGPLTVGPWQSEVDHWQVEASGTAFFDGSLSVSGAVVFSSPIVASATAVFNGPIRVGTGAGNGYAYLAQSATVAHNNSAGNPVTFTLPAGSDIIEIYSDVHDAWDAGTLGTAGNIEIGVSGSSQMLANIPVSASGTRLRGSALKSVTIQRWNNFTSHVGNGDASGRILAFVTARSQQATAMTIGSTYLTIVYVQRT